MVHEDISQYKSYLFTISYNLTGDVHTAEDLVQDTFEKWLSAEHTGVKNPKAYLSKIVVNKSIDSLAKRKQEQEMYKGLWLPEPFLEEIPAESNKDILDYAFLFLLEKLNPYERAVLVLREVFEYSYEEIGEIIKMEISNCRQILHRAKEKVYAPSKVTKEEKGKQQELLEAFMKAIHHKDMEKLKSLLKEDIVLYSDGGGKAAAALKPLYGIQKVVKFLIGVANLEKEVEFTFKEALMNGGPAILLFAQGIIHSVISIEISNGCIQNIFTIRNPDKIHF